METQKHTPMEIGNCSTCGHRSLAHTNAGECTYRDAGFDGTSARCACDMYMQPRQTHTPGQWRTKDQHDADILRMELEAEKGWYAGTEVSND